MKFANGFLWLAMGGCFIGVTVASKYDVKIPVRAKPKALCTRPSVVMPDPAEIAQSADLPDDAEIARSVVGLYHATVGMYYTPTTMEIFANGTYICGKKKGRWKMTSPRTIELRENIGGWVVNLRCHKLGSWSTGAPHGLQIGRHVNRSIMSK
jgi:hypothetical protein